MKNKWMIFLIIGLIVLLIGITVLFAIIMYNKSNRIVYRCDEKHWELNEDISSLPEGVEYVTDRADLIKLNSHSSKSFLKIVIKNNKVKEQYVGFVISEQFANANEGLKAGVYYLKGADKGVAYKDNKKILKEAFGEKNCKQEKYFYSCEVPNLSANADFQGGTSAGDDLYTCGTGGSSNTSSCLSFE